VFGHPGRTALPESRGVCVGQDHDAHRLIVPGVSPVPDLG
jgi:hypothetical protein